MDELKKFKLDDSTYATRFTRKFAQRKPYAPPNLKLVTAFIPGVIREVPAHEGARMKRGECMLVLEAMKMLNKVNCPLDGVVKKVYVATGDVVTKGQLLAEME